MNNASETLASGPISGLAAVSRNGIGLLLSRLDLAALELAELRNQLLRLTAVFLLGIVAIWFAVACASGAIVYLAWPVVGWTILLILAACFAIAAAAFFYYAHSLVSEGKLSLPATMIELKVDREILF